MPSLRPLHRSCRNQPPPPSSLLPSLLITFRSLSEMCLQLNSCILQRCSQRPAWFSIAVTFQWTAAVGISLVNNSALSRGYLDSALELGIISSCKYPVQNQPSVLLIHYSFWNMFEWSFLEYEVFGSSCQLEFCNKCPGCLNPYEVYLCHARLMPWLFRIVSKHETKYIYTCTL